MLSLLLPFEPRLGMWTAPLENGTALLALLALWIGCWYAARSLRRIPTWGEWSFFALLVVLKIAASGFLPSPGMWAKVTPLESGSAPVAAHKSVSPLRDIRPDGFVRYRDAFAPAHYINDHTRYDFFRSGQPDRAAYPAQIKAEFLLLADAPLMLAAPQGAFVYGEGVHEIQRTTTTTLLSYDPGNEAASSLLTFQTTATAGFSRPYLLAYLDGQTSELEPWRLWPPEEKSPSASTARILQTLGQSWNLLFCIFGALLWFKNAPFPSQPWFRTSQWFWAAGSLVLASALLPVSRAAVGLSTGIAFMLLAALALFLFRRRRDLLHPDVQLYAQGSILLAWAVIGTRFFLDRFPGGFAVLDAGMDSLFHYTYSMQILDGDWFHRFDAPFTRQPFVRYLITIPIVLFGEGAAWGFVCNWILYGAIGMQLAAVLRADSVIRAWTIFLLWFPFLIISPFRIWVPTLFPEVSSIVFLMASFLLLTLPGTGRGTSRLIGAGILFGLAVWTRNNLLLALPFWVLAVLFCWPQNRVVVFQSSLLSRYAWKAAFILGATVTAMVLVVTLRNKLLAPEAPLSLLLRPDMSALALFQGFLPDQLPGGGHVPPPTETAPAADYKHLFFAALRDNPTLFLKFQLDRLSGLLGGPAFWDPNLVNHYPKWNPLHLVLWGVVLGRFLRFGLRGMSSLPQLLCWGVLFSQSVLLIFTGFVGEGYRFVVPFYPFLLLLCFLPSRPAEVEPAAQNPAPSPEAPSPPELYPV